MSSVRTGAAVARTSLAVQAASFVGRVAGSVVGAALRGTVDAYRGPGPTDDGRGMEPGVPLEPTVVTPDALPRSYEVRVGTNLNVSPRSEDPRLAPFAMLRALADSHGTTRAVIQSIRSAVLSSDWDLVVREKYKTEAKALQGDVDALKTFFDMPDRSTPWDAWTSKLIDELLVTDAVTLLPRTDRARRPIALQLIDGTTIKPIADLLGQAPLPPAPAYQQILYGRPETEFSTAQILYRPKNARSWTLYGQPPVEMIAIIINLAIRRELHYLHFYTTGTLPDALYRVPAAWTDQQIQKIQDFFDSRMEGESARRAGRMWFVPGGADSGYEPTKDEEWKYEFDEYVNRVVSFAFGVSPMWVAKMVNRASAEQMDQGQNTQGVEPVKRFIRARINEYIRVWMGIPWAEFIWIEAREENEQLALEEDDRLLARGARTLDQVRARRGEEPLPDKLGAEPLIYTAQGAVRLRDVLEGPPDPQEPGAGGGGNGAGNKGPGKSGNNGGADDEAVKMELARWRKVARRDLAAGREPRGFQSQLIPTDMRKRLETRLMTSANPGEVDAAFALEKTRRKTAPAIQRARAEREVYKAVMHTFSLAYPAVKKRALERLSAAQPLTAMAKRDEGDLGPGWDELAGELGKILGRAAGAGAEAATGVLGFDFESAPEAALSYARSRAAELVGKKLVAGHLMDNPDARWAITDTLRADINSLVGEAIEKGWSPQELTSELREVAFSKWRAETIARTETARAYNRGASAAYKEHGVARVEVLDGAGCLPDGHDDGAGAPSGEPGVQDDAEANGQNWSVDEFEELPTGHPNCVRAAAPIVDTGSEGDTEEEE